MTAFGAILVALLLGLHTAPRVARAAFAGGNGKIVFVGDRDGDRDIYVMNADGSGEITLTSNTANDTAPRWSPDGTRIVFASDRDNGENPELYVMNADGSGQTRLTFGPGSSGSPAWSPDGNRIAFSSDRDGNPEIYVMDDGNSFIRLTTNPASDREPVWSPDGTKILFSSDRDGDFEIFVINVDGSGETQLTFNEAVDDGQPGWSPDGQRIVFTRGPFGGELDIWVMNADGSEQTQLTTSPAVDNLPSFSPDGTGILFSSDRHGDADVFVMNADGQEQTRLTTTAGADILADWQPTRPTGLISWWRAEGDARDSVGGNHGTLVNGTAFAPGMVGQGFRFDGIDDEVFVPESSSLNAAGGITIAAWVNYTTSGHGRVIGQKRSTGNVGGYTFETTHDPFGPNNGLQWVIWIDGGWRFLQTPDGVLENGEWQHVAATYDGRAMRVFVDGVERASREMTGTIRPSDDPFVVGRNVPTQSFAWDGVIDELEVYNRGLTASEVRYLAGNPGAPQQADLQLTQTDSPDPVDIGNPLTYTLTVANLGPSSATGVVVTDTLPAGSTFSSALTGTCTQLDSSVTCSVDPPGACTQANGIVTCHIGDVGSGNSRFIDITVTPTQAGELTNVAVVAGAQQDLAPGNNSDVETTEVNSPTTNADLSVNTTDTPDPATVGQPLTYNIAVSNGGPSAATNVVVTDTLPNGVVFVSASGGAAWICNHSSAVVTCTRATLAASSVSNITIIVTPTQAGSISNTVDVRASEEDANSSNNINGTTTQINPAATTSTLMSSVSPSTFSQSVTLTATVAPATATGLVTFYNGSAVLGSRSLVNGQAALSTTFLPAGGHTLTALYPGDSSHLPSTSVGLSQTVNARAQDSFHPAVHYPTFGAARAVAVGDVNGDGRADLAVGNGAFSLDILLGTGTGTFQPAVTYQTVGSPRGVALGDFNADGRLDVAVVSSSNAASVLLGNGNGTFQPWVPYSTGNMPSAIAISDFNRDGRLDLAVTNGGGNSLSVLLGRGDGTFLPQMMVAAGVQPASLVAVDVNRDGRADVAIAGDDGVTVLRGNGDGTFQAGTLVAELRFQRSIATADFNRDGIADLVSAGLGEQFALLVGTATGSFNPPVMFATDARQTAAAIVADINGDTLLDVATANPMSFDNNVTVVHGTPGSFLPAVSHIAGTGPTALAAGDFNGDGGTDLVVANETSNNVSVLLGTFGTTAVQVTTFPAGRSITVDGATYTAPHTFHWFPNTEHTIGTTSPQPGNIPGTRHLFTTWSDGGAITHSVTATSSAATYTANFTLQYFLETNVLPAGGGTITASPASPSGFYDPGTVVQLTATPTADYTFSNWTGSIAGSVNPQSITMAGPRSVFANFSAPACAANVTSQLTITPSGLRRNTITGRWIQGVAIVNRTTTPISGPFALALDNLTNGVTLFNPSGVTDCALPSGSPFKSIVVGADGVLGPGEIVNVSLEFVNPTISRILYTPRALAGANR